MNIVTGTAKKKMTNDEAELIDDLAHELQQPTAQDKQIQELEDALEKAKDRIKEERFIWIIIFIILFDVVFFSNMESFFGALVIFILELLILIPLARRMGMEELAGILDRVLARIASGVSNRD